MSVENSKIGVAQDVETRKTWTEPKLDVVDMRDTRGGSFGSGENIGLAGFAPS